MSTKIKAGILGASGYTGAELIRLLDRHPMVDLLSLGAHSRAGEKAHEVFPHLPEDLPEMVPFDQMPFSELDVVFAGLPHGKSAETIAMVYYDYPHLKLIDLSADFRFDDAASYKQAYGIDHPAPELLSEAVYGISEFYFERIKQARIVACTGCYCLCAEIGLYPLLKDQLIEKNSIVIDAKSGVSGAGRGLKPHLMFAEVNQGVNAYGVGVHRHLWEIEQQLSNASGEAIQISFTPHLVPMNRGLLSTCYVKLKADSKVSSLRDSLTKFYTDRPFVRVLPEGRDPKTQNVFGSNSIEIAVYADRRAGYAIIITTIDNLLKGASGMAVQNMNLMFDFPETAGLDRIAQYP